RRMVAGRDTEPGMPVDDARAASGNDDVGEQARGEAGADGRSLEGGHDGLGAVDHVVDDVVRGPPGALAGVPVVRHLLHQPQVAAGGVHAAVAAQQDDCRLRLGIDVGPYPAELVVAGFVERVELARIGQDDFQQARFRAVALERLVGLVPLRHVFRSPWRDDEGWGRIAPGGYWQRAAATVHDLLQRFAGGPGGHGRPAAGTAMARDRNTIPAVVARLGDSRTVARLASRFGVSPEQ